MGAFYVRPLPSTSLRRKKMEQIFAPHKIEMDGLKYAPEGWTFSGFTTYDKEKGQESLIISSSTDIGTESPELPLVALGPLLQTGFAEWNKWCGALYITRQLDFLTGNSTRNMRNGIRVKTIARRSEGDAIELQSAVDRTGEWIYGASIQGSETPGLISKADIEEFFNTVKLYDYEESIHHEIKEKQHILTGHAFLLYENAEEAQIKAKMTTTWQYATKDGEDSNKQAVYSVRRSVETRSDQFGEVSVAQVLERETLYSA